MTTRTSRLLIVDDNELNRDMLARRLKRKGYEVVLANGASELMQRLQEVTVDIVLLDIEMPEISGLEALKMLRETYSQIELPVIMVTAKNQSEDIVKALDLGANDYVTKPIDFAVTLARIGTQLSHKRAQEALRESEERLCAGRARIERRALGLEPASQLGLFLAALEGNAGVRGNRNWRQTRRVV